MPELPEVEIASRNLRRWAEGRRIARVTTDPRAARIFRPGDRAAFARALSGARLVGVDRRGKHLLVTLSDRRGRAVGLWSHLGMTGKWVLRGGGRRAAPRARPARPRRRPGPPLPRPPALRAAAPRRPRADFAALPEVAALGPDPVHDGIDPDRLAEPAPRHPAGGEGGAARPGGARRGREHPRQRVPLRGADRPPAPRSGGLDAVEVRGVPGHRRLAPAGDRDAGRPGNRLRGGAGGAQPLPRLRTGRGTMPALPRGGDPAHRPGPALDVLLPGLPGAGSARRASRRA